MKDTAEALHILILVYLTLTLIQGHRDTRNKEFWVMCLTEFRMELDGTWYVVETC